MNKKEYAAASHDEVTRYDGYKDGYIEDVGVQLPSTEMGAAARSKAIKEDRVMTNKAARLAGKAPLLRGEQKAKEMYETLKSRFGE